MTTDVATKQDGRELALLKAVGLDRVAPEQRELAIRIAGQYDLDLLLKHLVLIEGRAYITRDGLLHIAHRSGQFDGMTTSEPVLVDDFWRSTCSVFRKDMSHPFTYTGRYPVTGSNKKFAPEMAVKVGEVMALRRAFDVSAPTSEERWDLDAPEATEPPPPKPTLAAVVAHKAAAVSTANDDGPVVGISAADFKTWYESQAIDPDEAMAAAKRLFPGQKGLLDDTQRAVLKTVLARQVHDRQQADAFGDEEATPEPLGLA